MNNNDMGLLGQYGLNDFYLEQAANCDNWQLGRICGQYKNLYKIILADGEHLAEIAGKLAYHTEQLANYPAVGDFVLVDFKDDYDKAIIQRILKRKSLFLRSAVGLSEQAQVVAANIDIVFICMSLNNNFNLSRLERYLAIAWDSGAKPIIILTKADLCPDLAAKLIRVEEVAAFSPIIPLSIYDQELPGELIRHLKQGITAAFIGSSGVGKSSLINKILGLDSIATQTIGKADKGKHTTTGREMYLSQHGAILLDTPGMRELGAETVDLENSFNDIENLALSCRFKDCNHQNEPGCAVQAALVAGQIDERRLNNYFKLKNETSYQGLNSKQIEQQKHERMFKEVGGIKNARKFIKGRP